MAPRVAAESVPRSKAKHESLIQRLGLKAEADEQDKEFAAQASGETMVDSSATITPTSRKGKSTDRQLVDQWRSMTMKEKKAKVVLDARRYVFGAFTGSLICTWHAQFYVVTNLLHLWQTDIGERPEGSCNGVITFWCVFLW